MKFEIVTLFPDYFRQPLRQSLLGKGSDKKLFDIEIINLRDYATDRHLSVDDRPYGGSAGMVLMVPPLDRCLQDLDYQPRSKGGQSGQTSLLLMSAAGKVFDQQMARRLSLRDRVTIICGHYLGVDERLLNLYDVQEVSIGDYTLTGGEPAALVMVDAIARLIPGVLGDFESALNDSHMDGLLGAPQYTRPAEYLGLEVPPSLLSGDHRRIERFRRAMALTKCLKRRPDLITDRQLSNDDRKLLSEFENEIKEYMEKGLSDETHSPD